MNTFFRNVFLTSLLLIGSSYSFASNKSNSTNHIQSIVLGSGCFWGAEKGYESIPGVIEAVSGYADGRGIKPTYRDITQLKNRLNPDNYAEVVKVTFNSQILSLEDLLKHYFESHDPTPVSYTHLTLPTILRV